MLRLLSPLLLLALLANAVPAAAADAHIPRFWDVKERLIRPDVTTLPRIRFLTTVDFPPFNFIDSNGLLTGFHVDLARLLCRELDMLDRCQIQALPWEELEAAMENGQGEAMIAGLSITPQSRGKFAFTRSYLRFPARFAAQMDATFSEPIWRAMAARRVGVMAGTEHEAMLRDYFPEARAVTYTRQEWLHGALRAGKIDAIFDDGMRTSFWLSGTAAAGCCKFVGGPYLAPEYFGAGLAIAVKPENAELADAFDYALREINMNGAFEELYLRYFPISFF